MHKLFDSYSRYKLMSVRIAILALLVGVLSVVAEYTQPTIWPQV